MDKYESRVRAIAIARVSASDVWTSRNSLNEGYFYTPLEFVPGIPAKKGNNAV